MPVIAIVGRPNVGKSSLLNALSGRTISIVQDMPGVTRDRISTPLDVRGKFAELVDTGGYGFQDDTGLTEHIKHQIELAMARADLVMFIVDCAAGLTGGDEQIASMLRRQGIKTVLVANKCDGDRTDVALAEFSRLGLGTPLGVSAMNGRNIDGIIDLIAKTIDMSEAPTQLPAPQLMIAIVGKRNAGKSTLVNAIAELYESDSDRVIVSEVPGTTRDSVDVRFEKEGKTLIVIDTAGVRKKRHMMTNDIEFYSFHRAERSIRRADVVMMLIDGTERVSEPDKKLARYIAEQHKPVIKVINKWDLVLENANKQAKEREVPFGSDVLMDEFSEYLDQDLQHLNFAPEAFITAKDGRNIQVIVDLAQHLFRQASTRVTTSQLNQAVEQIMEERAPATPTGRRIKVYYATQTDTNPPTIVLFVNQPDWVRDSYQRYMINRLRELLPYPEVPIKLILRGSGEKRKGAKSGGAKPGAAKSGGGRTAPDRTRLAQKPDAPKRPVKPSSKPKVRGRGKVAKKSRR